jgi:hypothetical protein
MKESSPATLDIILYIVYIFTSNNQVFGGFNMAGMSLGDIVADAQLKIDAETEFFAKQLMTLLEEHVPSTQKEAFMARLSATMESLGDRHARRIAVFNEVHRQLHAENRQR